MADTKDVVLALRQYDADVEQLKMCLRPELSAASRLRRTWGKDGDVPGHAGVQPGAVFSHVAQLVLLGLHGSVFKDCSHLEPDQRSTQGHFWARNKQLLAISLDIDMNEQLPAMLPEQGLYWSERKANKTTDKAECIVVEGVAGTYDGQPNGKHQDKGSAGLLTSALQSKQVVRVVRAFQVPEAGTMTKWWIYAGLFKVVGTDKFKSNKQVTCKYQLQGVPGQSLRHQELRDCVSKVHKGTRRGMHPTKPLPRPASKAPAARASQAAAPDPDASKSKPSPSSGSADGDDADASLHVMDLDSQDDDDQDAAALQPVETGHGQKRPRETAEETGAASKKPRPPAQSEAELIKAWQVGLTSRPHVIRMDLTRSDRLPVPVFKDPPPAHLALDAQAEQDAAAELEFEYVHDYTWAEGVLKEVWPVLMHEENVMRKTAAQLRQHKHDQGGDGAGLITQVTASSAEAWWTAGPKRPMCGILLHAYLHSQHLAAERQLAQIPPNVPPEHRASLAVAQSRIHVFDDDGCVSSARPGMPVLHQCHVGCTAFPGMCSANQKLLDGPTLPLEVFRAYTPAPGSAQPDTGPALIKHAPIPQGHWGVRCHLPIRQGRFVCCILGQINTMAGVMEVIPHPHVMHLGHVAMTWQWLQSEGVSRMREGQEIRLADMPAPPTSSPFTNCKAFWRSPAQPAPTDNSPGKDGLSAIWRRCTLGEQEERGVKYPGSLCLLALDNRAHGNVSRFIRHSFRPNLHLQTVYAGSCRSACLYYLALVAAEDIPAGEELTYDHTCAVWLPSPPSETVDAEQSA